MLHHLLHMRGIVKSFGGIRALDDVSLMLEPGEIRALVGENGAGKSTLMKILSGAVAADGGQIVLDGTPVIAATPAQMLRAGIAVIYQEFAQAPHLSVAENISLGALPCGTPGAVDWGALRVRAQRALQTLGYAMDVDRRVASLSVAQRQIVEIARAVARDARLIVLDEPSAVLGDAEVERLFALMRKLRNERQVAFVYVSHRLQEIFDVCDSATVLRDGRHVVTGPVLSFTRDSLVRSMVGRDLTHLFPERVARPPGPVALAVADLRSDRLHGVSLDVRRGEIVGLCGLSGAGRSEVLMAIAGADGRQSGTIAVNGRSVVIRSPREALRHGIGLIPEDRKTQGLCLNQSVGFNMSLSALGSLAKAGVIRTGREIAAVRSHIGKLRVKARGPQMRIGHLSGGNQQKCIIGRQLIARSDILLIDEPTRGVDVGARREIYDLLTGLAHTEGLAILMVSSDMPEVMGLCDRIYVMRAGRIAAELPGPTATEEEIMSHAAH